MPAAKKVVNKKPVKTKGVNKKFEEDPSNNPLLLIRDKIDFQIEVKNLLDETDSILFPAYDDFDFGVGNVDLNLLTDRSNLIVVARYYEYLSVATFNFSYLKPLLQSGLSAIEVIETIKHALRMKYYVV